MNGKGRLCAPLFQKGKTAYRGALSDGLGPTVSYERIKGLDGALDPSSPMTRSFYVYGS